MDPLQPQREPTTQRARSTGAQRTSERRCAQSRWRNVQYLLTKKLTNDPGEVATSQVVVKVVREPTRATAA